MKIDTHNHAMPEEVIELVNSDRVYDVSIQKGRWKGGAHVDFALTDSFSSPQAKLAELEANGLEGAVISAMPPLFYYDVTPEAGSTMCRTTNDGLKRFCEHSPDRFRWMAHVPMQAPEAAVQMLEQAARDGASGVEVGTSIAGRRLDEPAFEGFWSAVERHQLPVLIHPAYNEPNHALNSYYFQNVIGNMLETTIALERLICAGTLDRHPKARIVLVHSGGYFPYQAGRLRHARTVRPELSQSPADPWAYIGQLVFDTITHDALALE
ncbi:MAG: amidohydrolase family protein, partial [Thermoplasmata archaeon]